MAYAGGCWCGAVRYRLSAEPIRGFQCQCRDCQMDSGGGHTSVFVFLRSAFEISGEVREVVRTSDRGAIKRKGFCPTCGVSIYNKPVKSPSDVTNAVRTVEKSGRKSVAMLINRQGSQQFVAVPLGNA